MTPDMDICPGAAQRTEAAQHLIARARDGELVDLAVVSALDLCVLGGTEPPLLDEAVARAWNRLGGRQRDKTADAVTKTLLDRGLLTDEGLRTSARPRSGRYAPRPELGLVLAARRHPSFVVRTEAEGQDLCGLRLFALGDQAEPARGLVVGAPAALPPDRAGDFRVARKLGPLGWIYRYVLVSREQAPGSAPSCSAWSPGHAGDRATSAVRRACPPSRPAGPPAPVLRRRPASGRPRPGSGR